MAKTPKMGRASIFRDKADGIRVQGIITKQGGKDFEVARENLRELYERVIGEAPTAVSDADVIEYMARGWEQTKLYLVKHSRA